MASASDNAPQERGLSRVTQRLQQRWAAFAARAGQISRRPFLVNVGSVLQRIPFRPLDINCLYFLDYDGLPPQHANFLRGRAEVRSGTIEDLEGLTNCQNKPQTFLNRFKANDYCAVATVDDRIVGYQWYCDRPSHVEERYSYNIEIPPDAIYAYDLFIAPEHRLGGIWFKFYSLHLRELMQRLHRRRIIIMVDYGNKLSTNSHLRFGFKFFRRVFIVKMFGMSLFISKTLRSDAVVPPPSTAALHNPGTRGENP